MDKINLRLEIKPLVAEINNYIPNYQEYNYMPTPYFRKSGNLYNNERELYGVLQMESFNIYGVKLQYYVISYDINYNKIWGEDNDRRYINSYNIYGYYQLPKESKIISKFGIEGIDSFKIFINKMHFNKITGGNGTYPIIGGYKPKIGDIIRSIYNNYYYEITNVNHTEEMFLQFKHCWDLMIKPINKEHIS